MRPRDEVLRAHVREWIAKAEIDYRTAEWLLTSPEPIRESIGFHCQQAAEKILKALLSDVGVRFRKTHEIGALMALLTQPTCHARLCQPDWRMLTKLWGEVVA